MDRQRRGKNEGWGSANEVTPGPAPRRLFDRSGSSWSSSEARAVALLRTAAPYRETPGRKERVRIALTEATVRPRRLLLRPLVVLGIVVGGGAMASAAVWHWPARVIEAYGRLTPGSQGPMARADNSVHVTSRRHVVPRIRETASEDPPGADGNLAVTAPYETTAPIGRPIGRRVAGSRATDVEASSRHEVAGHPRSRHSAPVYTGEDTTSVSAAMRALRRAHDPLRARLLLDTYLTQHPGGALAEEALALSIEAAVAHGDPDAGALADRYLRLYPAGPFRALARQTLVSLAPR